MKITLPSPQRWLRSDLDTAPCTSGILVDPGEIDSRFQQAWLPFFSRATRRHADVDEFLRNLGDWFITCDGPQSDSVVHHCVEH